MTENEKERIVDGFVFEDENEYSKAQKEWEIIQKINNEINGKGAREVFSAYNKIIEKNIFHTIIGYEYLNGLRKILIDNPAIPNNDIQNINVRIKKASKAQKVNSNDKVKNQKIENLKFKVKAFTFINIVLVIVIIAMFVISSRAKKFDVNKYQQKIEDKYAAWEEELNERENELKIREKSLK